MSAERSWRCPACAHESRSSRGVRARWCTKCGVWCMRTDAVEESLSERWFAEPEMGAPPLSSTPDTEVLFEAPGVFEGFGGKPGSA